MKKYLWVFGALMMVLGLCGCSDGDGSELDSGNLIFESNPTTLDGTWCMVSASFAENGIKEYQPDDVVVTFNAATGTMRVENKRVNIFLKTGTYFYTTTTKKDPNFDTESRVLVIRWSDEAFDDMEARCTYYFHDGMLCLDWGVAVDGPGYYFRKPIQNQNWPRLL
ncbi:MAG: hypothetical protein IJV25_07075 [Prevotella sp.]|nr:hypothetical protein [Prevotella sp.]